MFYGQDITGLDRVSRTSVRDDWDNCGFCSKDFNLGYRIHLETGVVNVCEECLSAAKKVKFLRHENNKTKEI